MTRYKTRTGRTLADADIHALAEEAEAGVYDVDALKKRRRLPSAANSELRAAHHTGPGAAER